MRSVKYLPVLAAVWMVAGCGRKQGTPVQTATTTGPAQVATPAYRAGYDRIFGKKQKVGIA